MIPLRPAVFILGVFLAAPSFAQDRKPPPQSASDKERIERARARCQENRGVDCNSLEGLKEWLLQERSREEAVREGSRHRLTAPAPARR